MRFIRTFRLALPVLVALGVVGCQRDVPPPPEATNKSPESAPPTKRVVGPLSEADAAALATMNDRLKAYVELHKKIEDELPKLPKDATPQQIDQHQREFEKRICASAQGREAGRNLHAARRSRSSVACSRRFSMGPKGKQLLATDPRREPRRDEAGSEHALPGRGANFDDAARRSCKRSRSCLKTWSTDSSAAISSCSMRTLTSWRTSSSTPFPSDGHTPMRTPVMVFGSATRRDLPAATACRNSNAEPTVEAQAAQPAVPLPNKNGTFKFGVLGDFGTGDRAAVRTRERR